VNSEVIDKFKSMKRPLSVKSEDEISRKKLKLDEDTEPLSPAGENISEESTSEVKMNVGSTGEEPPKKSVPVILLSGFTVAYKAKVCVILLHGLFYFYGKSF